MFLSSSLFKHLTIGYLEEGGLSWLTVFRGTVYCVRNRVTSRCLFGIGSREGAGNMAGELISRLETGKNTFIHTHICLLDKSIAGPQPLCTSSYPKLHLSGFSSHPHSPQQLIRCLAAFSGVQVFRSLYPCLFCSSCFLLSLAAISFLLFLFYPVGYSKQTQETLGEPVVFLWW